MSGFTSDGPEHFLLLNELDIKDEICKAVFLCEDGTLPIMINISLMFFDINVKTHSPDVESNLVSNIGIPVCHTSSHKLVGNHSVSRGRKS